jgi:hypothetical protein
MSSSYDCSKSFTLYSLADPSSRTLSSTSGSIQPRCDNYAKTSCRNINHSDWYFCILMAIIHTDQWIGATWGNSRTVNHYSQSESAYGCLEMVKPGCFWELWDVLANIKGWCCSFWWTSKQLIVAAKTIFIWTTSSEVVIWDGMIVKLRL